MEGAEITLERLDFVLKAFKGGTLVDQVFCGVPRRPAARGLHPLRRRLLPAARRRQVDGHRRDRQRLAGRVGAEPRLHEERRRVRAPVLRRHRQRRRPPGDGQSGGADARVPREVRRAGRRRHRHAKLAGAGRTSSSHACTISRCHEKKQRAALRVKSRSRIQRDVRDQRSRYDPHAERLIQVRDQIRRVLEADRQPQHPLGHARVAAAARRCGPTATSAPAC